MSEKENANNQDDALKDTVNPDMDAQQEPVDEQPKQEEPVETEEPKGDNVTEKKSRRFKIRHAQEKALEEEKAKYAELNDKYLRLFSEFDNFRKRTAKEKLDLTATASESVIRDILPVLDDFERALAVKNDDEGVQLIYNKMMKILEQKGLKAMEVKGEKFDESLHEAVTQIPAPAPEQKGTVIDVVEKGYYLNDKVLRYAKVVVAC